VETEEELHPYRLSPVCREKKKGGDQMAKWQYPMAKCKSCGQELPDVLLDEETGLCLECHYPVEISPVTSPIGIIVPGRQRHHKVYYHDPDADGSWANGIKILEG